MHTCMHACTSDSHYMRACTHACVRDREKRVREHGVVNDFVSLRILHQCLRACVADREELESENSRLASKDRTPLITGVHEYQKGLRAGARTHANDGLEKPVYTHL